MLLSTWAFAYLCRNICVRAARRYGMAIPVAAIELKKPRSQEQPLSFWIVRGLAIRGVTVAGRSCLTSPKTALR